MVTLPLFSRQQFFKYILIQLNLLKMCSYKPMLPLNAEYGKKKLEKLGTVRHNVMRTLTCEEQTRSGILSGRLSHLFQEETALEVGVGMNNRVQICLTP